MARSATVVEDGDGAWGTPLYTPRGGERKIRRRAYAAVIVVAGLLVGVATPGRAQARAPELANDRLRVAIEQLAARSHGQLGVGIELLETGEQLLVNGTRRFPMQSVYKLPIAMATLHAVDRGRLDLDQMVSVTAADFVTDQQHSPIRDAHPAGVRMSLRELVRYTVAESDGTASDVLLRLLGGAPAVASYLRELGVREVAVLDTEKQIGSDWRVQYRNWATPRGALALLRAVQRRGTLADSTRRILDQHLIVTETGLRRLRAGVPAGVTVAHKTGSSGSRDGLAAATNDVGIITLPDGRHLAVAVFLSDSRADDAARDAIIAGVAEAAWRAATRN